MAKENRTSLVIRKIVLLNNRTDKKYTIVSQNNFGLGWGYLPNGVLNIQQFTTAELTWIAVAQFQDHSIIELIRK